MELLERPNRVWFFVGIAASDFHGFPNTTDGLPGEDLSRIDAEIRDKLGWVRNGDSITAGPGVDRDLGIITINGEIVGWGMTCGLGRSWQPVAVDVLRGSVGYYRKVGIIVRTLDAAYPDLSRPDLIKKVQLYCFCDIHEGE